MQIVRFALTTLAIIAGAAVAQTPDSVAATHSVVYGVSSVGGSGLSGSVFLGSFGADTTIVVVDLSGTRAGATHPSHVHVGDCGSGGGIRIPLADVDGATGLGVTLLRSPLNAIVSADLYLNVHRSASDLQSIVACGEVGTGAARLSAGAAMDQGTAATTDGPATGTPATASYGLFPVNDSGIQGQVQLTEDVEGGTKFVVTLTGIDPGLTYPLALYRGDCGPDRPKVADLDAVGTFEDDPYASVTQTDLEFAEIASGDFFMYVFRADDPDRIAACGEIGRGANR